MCFKRRKISRKEFELYCHGDYDDYFASKKSEKVKDVVRDEIVDAKSNSVSNKETSFVKDEPEYNKDLVNSILGSDCSVVVFDGQQEYGKDEILSFLNNIKKSTMKFVSLNDKQALQLAKTNINLFFDTYGYSLLIDDPQKEPMVFVKISEIVQQFKNEWKDTRGLFWLTAKSISDGTKFDKCLFSIKCKYSRFWLSLGGWRKGIEKRGYLDKDLGAVVYLDAKNNTKK